MSASSFDRALRTAGVGLLIAVALIATWSAVATGGSAMTEKGLPREATDLGGRIEFYDEDTIVISTTTEGIARVRIDARTSVREPEGPAEVTALLPGRLVAIWVRGSKLGGEPVARAMLVWGAASR
jgi:hypothetical protein